MKKNTPAAYTTAQLKKELESRSCHCFDTEDDMIAYLEGEGYGIVNEDYTDLTTIQDEELEEELQSRGYIIMDGSISLHQYENHLFQQFLTSAYGRGSLDRQQAKQFIAWWIDNYMRPVITIK